MLNRISDYTTATTEGVKLVFPLFMLLNSSSLYVLVYCTKYRKISMF